MDKERFLLIIFLLSQACVNEVLCSCCQDLYVTSNVILPLGVLGKKIVVEEWFYLGTSFTLFLSDLVKIWDLRKNRLLSKLMTGTSA